MDEKGKDLMRIEKELELVFQDGEKTVTVEVKVSFLMQDNEEDECRTPNKERIK